MYQYISGEYVNVLRPDVKPGAWRVVIVLLDKVLLEDSNNPEDAYIHLPLDEVEPAIGIHAHVDVRARDCDGVVSSGSIVQPDLSHRRHQFGDLLFKEAVLGSCVHFHQEGRVEIRPDEVEITQYTDEGYRQTMIAWCDSKCSGDERWYRDHSAEAAGY